MEPEAFCLEEYPFVEPPFSFHVILEAAPNRGHPKSTNREFEIHVENTHTGTQKTHPMGTPDASTPGSCLASPEKRLESGYPFFCSLFGNPPPKKGTNYWGPSCFCGVSPVVRGLFFLPVLISFSRDVRKLESRSCGMNRRTSGFFSTAAMMNSCQMGVAQN